jgi:hypothetical protein
MAQKGRGGRLTLGAYGAVGVRTVRVSHKITSSHNGSRDALYACRTLAFNMTRCLCVPLEWYCLWCEDVCHTFPG